MFIAVAIVITEETQFTVIMRMEWKQRKAVSIFHTQPPSNHNCNEK